MRSRRVAETLTAAAGATALLWAVATALDDPGVDRTLGLSAAVVGAAVAGHGLAGADTDLERTAAIDWRPRRAAHVALVVAAVLGIVAATALTGHSLGQVGGVARNAVGACGLVALAATTLGASRAWVPPILWAMAAPGILHQFWPTPGEPGYAQVLTWPDQPAASGAAVITAVVLGAAGTGAYAILGPRP
ncbi:MAG: hypothetical protein ACRD2C_17795 [Acidimicrobiales bacterium]